MSVGAVAASRAREERRGDVACVERVVRVERVERGYAEGSRMLWRKGAMAGEMSEMGDMIVSGAERVARARGWRERRRRGMVCRSWLIGGR